MRLRLRASLLDRISTAADPVARPVADHDRAALGVLMLDHSDERAGAPAV